MTSAVLPVLSTTNLLLNILTDADLGLLRPHLEYVSLAKGEVLVAPRVPIEHAVFPDDGLVSMIATFPGGWGIEVALCGREGFSGFTTLLGSETSLHKAVVQIAGQGHRISSQALLDATNRSASLRTLLLRYIHCAGTQMAFTVLTNAKCSVEQRLARWLLMAHDRQSDDDIPLTHDTLALMLGVQRPTVTTALHSLEGQGLIRSSRALVVIRRRRELERIAGMAYGSCEAEYERLIGSFRDR